MREMSPEQKKVYDEVADQVAKESAAQNNARLSELLSGISVMQTAHIQEKRRRYPWLAFKQRWKDFWRNLLSG